MLRILISRAYKVNAAGPEKESSQNRAGDVSEGKAPFEKSGNRSNLSGSRADADAGSFEVYGR
jgi:hypothetical protein